MADRRDTMGKFGKFMPEGTLDTSNLRAMTYTFAIDDGEGEEPKEYTLRCKLEVCGTCQGTGSHVNPSIDSHGITSEEWERDWSHEDRDNYMSGMYDVQCYECHGKRVSPTIDYQTSDKQALKVLREWQREEREYRSLVESEERFGC